MLIGITYNTIGYNYNLLFTERNNAAQFEFNADLLDNTVDVLTDAEYYANLVIDYGHVFGNSIYQ